MIHVSSWKSVMELDGCIMAKAGELGFGLDWVLACK